MPIYEYQCPKGHKSEKLFLASSARKTSMTINCPQCNGKAYKVFSKTSKPVIKGYNAENGYSK